MAPRPGPRRTGKPQLRLQQALAASRRRNHCRSLIKRLSSQVFIRRLDLVHARDWANRFGFLSRLSVCERGLLLVTSLNRAVAKFQNAKLVRQLTAILTKLDTWIQHARKLLTLAQHARKRRWKSTQSLGAVIMKRGYVPGNYALGDAGLHEPALTVYRALKHGLLPSLAIHLYF